MIQTPKGLRMHIGIFGRRNVGKSSILNALTNQEVSIVSPEKGTTTDPVDKAMELQPVGPVLFIDTAGLDDEGNLGELRIARTKAVYDRTDLGLVVTDGVWGDDETEIAAQLEARNVPWIAVLNQSDRNDYAALRQLLTDRNVPVAVVCAKERRGLDALREAIVTHAPAEFIETPHLVGDLVGENAHVILVVPIDKEAPKGRLILPQVQTIRDLLDTHAVCTVCRENQVTQVLQSMREPPALVVTDSQAFGIVDAQLPRDIPLTGFSVLFARCKGDLGIMAAGAREIARLSPGDRILIAEACTHHPIQDDIGRVKIPRWLQNTAGGELAIDVVSGTDFPEDLRPYRLIVHCGGCMWNRRQMLCRIAKAQSQGVPITNYGLAIAALHGILDRALEPFHLERQV